MKYVNMMKYIKFIEVNVQEFVTRDLQTVHYQL